MAVIITNMDIPKGCWYETDKKMSGVTTCPLIGECKRKYIDVNKLNERPKDCPLKSTDEMIAEIEHRKEALDYTLNILVKGDSMEERLKGAKEAVEEMIEIAHKYCDKEQHNG